MWHTITIYKQGDIITKWTKIWKTKISWVTTWPHVHIEYWDGDLNYNYLHSKYNPRWMALLTQRWWTHTFYFSSYTLWDVRQNDSSPCRWAWGELCELNRRWIRTLALTVDQRTLLWIPLWSNVILNCNWKKKQYKVMDEMNIRYRKNCIMRNWACVKGDLWLLPWEKTDMWGVCKINLINK